MRISSGARYHLVTTCLVSCRVKPILWTRDDEMDYHSSSVNLVHTGGDDRELDVDFDASSESFSLGVLDMDSVSTIRAKPKSHIWGG